MPKRVVQFKAEIAAADALLFVTPEHSRSIPALLKNAIDQAVSPKLVGRKARGHYGSIARCAWYATGRSSCNVTNDGTLRGSREDGRMQ
jgi:NAD(P)H-dependent FMN reductase